MSGRVLVVGSVNVDLVVRGERLPEPGETVLGGTFGRFHGGKGGNQAVAAARLGRRGRARRGAGRRRVRRRGASRRSTAQGVGTDVRRARLDGQATGVALILVDADGENLIAVAPGANAAVTEAQRPRRRSAPSSPRRATSSSSPTRSRPAAAREALRLARERRRDHGAQPGAGDGLDRADPRARRRPDAQPRRARAPRDRRLPAAPAARRPAREDPIRAARTLLDATSEGPGVGHAILVSLGAAGAVLVQRDGPALDIASPTVTAVDATGAGDTLNGALAAGLAARPGPRDRGPPRRRRGQPVRDPRRAPARGCRRRPSSRRRSRAVPSRRARGAPQAPLTASITRSAFQRIIPA